MGFDMTKLQVEVKVLVSMFTDELTRWINEYILLGWQLQGAVTPVYKDGVTSFMATMIKEI